MPDHEADHVTPPNTDVKNVWKYTSTPPVRLHGFGRDNYKLTFTLSIGTDKGRAWGGVVVRLTTNYLQVTMSRNLEALTSQNLMGPIGL
jgi:hypothetical protein